MVGCSRISFRSTLYRSGETLFLRVSHAILSLFPWAPSTALLRLRICLLKSGSASVGCSSVLGASESYLRHPRDEGPAELHTLELAVHDVRGPLLEDLHGAHRPGHSFGRECARLVHDLGER